MSQENLEREMRVTLDQAVKDPFLADSPAEERAAWAEKRHLFWRKRCLEHARTIDRQEAQIHELVDTIRALEKAANDALTAASTPVAWVESEPSCRNSSVGSVIHGMCVSWKLHPSRPTTDNPVWPLYAEPLHGSQDPR